MTVLFWAALCAACGSCADTDDTAAIRGLIARGAECAEAHDIGGIMDLAARDLTAEPGGLDHRAVRGVLWNAFNHYGPLKVLYPRPEVEVGEGSLQAWARFPFMIVKKDRQVPGLENLVEDPAAWLDAVGSNADVYRLNLRLGKTGGRWAVELARLERFSGMGFTE